MKKTNTFLMFCFFIFISCPAFAASQSQINCGSAKGKIERLICQAPVLIESDKKLNQAYQSILEKLSEKRRHSFVRGEKNWLEIRNTACVTDDAKFDNQHQISCLQNIYDARIKEITEQEATRIMGKVDYDAVLDKPMDASSTMYAYNGGDIFYGKPIIVNTCREFYVFSSGDYEFSIDNIGGKNSAWTISHCAYGLLVAQFADSPDKKDAETVFSDISKYSDEFECVAAAHVCHEDELKMASFGELQKQGKLKIIYGENTHSESDHDEPTLFITENSFGDDMTWDIDDFALGDFTHQGRKEAIMLVSTSVFRASWGARDLILAYYDEQKHMVRPERIVLPNRTQGPYHMSTEAIW